MQSIQINKNAIDLNMKCTHKQSIMFNILPFGQAMIIAMVIFKNSPNRAIGLQIFLEYEFIAVNWRCWNYTIENEPILMPAQTICLYSTILKVATAIRYWFQEMKSFSLLELNSLAFSLRLIHFNQLKRWMYDRALRLIGKMMKLVHFVRLTRNFKKIYSVTKFLSLFFSFRFYFSHFISNT